MKIKIILLLLFTPLIQSPALDNRIVIETWYEIEQYSNWEYDEFDNVDFMEPAETKTRELLEEARLLLSSMVYGYSFEYIPKDNARGVAEWFNLEPVEEIQWGDPQLDIFECRREENKIICRIIYNLNDYQVARRTSWYSNTIPYSSGTGSENYFLGSTAKLDAFKNSIKEAIRNYARERIVNKPREIRGDLLVWDAPYTIINEGEYKSTVRIKLMILEIIPYKVF